MREFEGRALKVLGSIFCQNILFQQLSEKNAEKSTKTSDLFFCIHQFLHQLQFLFYQFHFPSFMILCNIETALATRNILIPSSFSRSPRADSAAPHHPASNPAAPAGAKSAAENRSNPSSGSTANGWRRGFPYLRRKFSDARCADSPVSRGTRSPGSAREIPENRSDFCSAYRPCPSAPQ